VREKRFFTFSFPVTLTLDLFILELHHHSQVYRVTYPKKYKLFTTFQYWVKERCVTDRQSNITKRWVFPLVKCIRRYVWSWFDVSRSIFDEDTRKANFTLSLQVTLTFWPLDLKFFSMVTFVQRYASQIISFSFYYGFRLSYFEKIDRRHLTDRQTWCNA